MRDEDDGYGYIYPKNLPKFDSEKVITNILSKYNGFVADTTGEFYFVGGGNAGAYGLELEENVSDRSILYYVALLNSRALEFYHKYIAPIFGESTTRTTSGISNPIRSSCPRTPPRTMSVAWPRRFNTTGRKSPTWNPKQRTSGTT